MEITVIPTYILESPVHRNGIDATGRDALDEVHSGVHGWEKPYLTAQGF